VKFALHRQELVIGVNMRILKRLTKEKIAAEKRRGEEDVRCPNTVGVIRVYVTCWHLALNLTSSYIKINYCE
jgi:hypothetical protein